MLSERGAESRAALTEEEQNNLCLARLFIAGWHFAPVKSSDGQIKGTKICYLQSADAGGNIPSALQNKAGPKQAKDTALNLITMIKQRHTEEFLQNVAEAELVPMMANLKKKFDAASSLSDEQKDLGYALYQQATHGENKTEKPGMFSREGRRQWDAWTSKKGMSQKDATLAFIKLARPLVH